MKINRKRISIYFLLIIILICFIIGFTYLNDYYHVDKEKLKSFSLDYNVSKKILDDNKIIYGEENSEVGIVFYPGGKVEYLSYEPLMKICASYGFMCVLVEMPFNLAVFDINAADGIQEKFLDIDKWYIGGHSLGGAMAATYLANNIEKFDGLILLGAYSTQDLSDTSLKVISIYGSEDKILNKKKYNDNIRNLPIDYEEVIIDGGNHAYFGIYGKQDGDGNAKITNEEQINKTMEIIANYILY